MDKVLQKNGKKHKSGIFIKIVEYVLTVLFYIVLPFYAINRIILGKSHGWRKRFGFCQKFDENVIMIHGCSVGEINAVGNLVKKIKEEYPNYKVVLTTSTATGQNVAKKKYFEVADYITYFPFDTINETKRFLDHINPKIVLILETEIWPCFANACARRHIPLYIINGRISYDTIPWYRFFRFYFRKVLEKYNGIYTQSNVDTEKFGLILGNKEKITLMGNLKFDISPSADTDIDLGQKGYRVLIAGSTHKKEHNAVIKTFVKLKKDFNDLKFIIAPRHLKRVGEIESLCKKNNLKYGHRSSGDKFTDNDVIILDTLGELGKMYSVCDIAYIGGSLDKTGGHNPLEAAIYNKPVVSGDCVDNFKDIYAILSKCGAAKIVKNGNELYLKLKNILSDNTVYENMAKACTVAFEQQRNATQYVLDIVEKHCSET